MQGFVQGADRQQTTLLPECLDDWVGESNPIRAVDVFIDALELRDLGFDGVDPAATGRPAYHPSPMLKLYIYGYLNRVQSSRRLEREAGRNLEVMWLEAAMLKLKDYVHKDITADDIQGIHDFIKDADIVDGPDALYALVAEAWPYLLHKVKPPRSLMH